MSVRILARQRLDLLVRQSVGITDLVDARRFEVSVREHTVFLSIARVATLFHSLLHLLIAGADGTWGSKVWASRRIVDYLRRALMRAIRTLLSLILAVHAHILVAIG